MLIGDIPNTDQKNRFMESEFGKQFYKEWLESQTAHNDSASFNPWLDHEEDTARFSPDDRSIMKLMAELRTTGANVYLLPQPPNLPFGHTRADILVSVL